MALRGLKVIELAGLAPAPYCGMILSDFGASVIRVDKPTGAIAPDKLSRGKRSLVLDLQQKAGVSILEKMCTNADVLLEPFRKGVMEKLNLGPEKLLSLNKRLIYARLTGFGQKGPFSRMAGHDINYLALSGVLSMLASKNESPKPPINLLADFAGGGMLCALGICLALLERCKSGEGQVIDANMVQGCAYLASWIWKSQHPSFPLPIWGKPPGENLLDGGAPFYQTYKTKDCKYMAVGAIEPQFYKKLLKGLELKEEDFPQYDNWDNTRETFAKIFATKTRDEWCNLFDYKDACTTAVLTANEAPFHPHNIESQSFLPSDDEYHYPNVAPLLSRTPGIAQLEEPIFCEHTKEILSETGYSSEEIERFIDQGIAIAQNDKSKL